MAQPYMIIPAQGSDQADEWLRLGVDAQIGGRLPEAQQRYQQALRLDPRHAVAMQNLAIVFAQSNLLNEALLTIERAAMCDGVHSAIQMNWALMALEAERIDEALAAARRAVAMKPDTASRMALAMALTTAGHADEALPIYNAILDEEPNHAAAGPNSCFIQTLCDLTPAELLAQRKRWWEANRYKGVIARHVNEKSMDRPLRVGYVGGDFKAHSAAFIFGRVVLHHSSKIIPYLYSSLPVDPAIDMATKQYRDVAGDRWRDITTMPDDKVDELIRSDKIDILVDLAGHTNGGRLPLFTRKPAPVQVTAWGFAHGTGCPEIDYFFADPIAVPPEERRHYAEKIWDLPCIVSFEEPTHYQLKGTSTPPIRKNGYITFGAYARYEKMSEQCLKTFADVLRAVPDSKIEFKDNGYRRPFSLRRIMKAMPDIAPERLLFSTATTHPDHLLAYQQADIILDPYPHGGGVVGMEQLYMGVPIVTMYSKQPSGRTTSSVLTAMGRTDWIAKTPEQYIEIAAKMAEDAKGIAKARQTLRDEFLKSPVVAGYVEAVETAYADMWKEWCSR